MPGNQALGFVEICIGGILIVMGFTGDSLANVVKGNITSNPLTNASMTTTGANVSTSTNSSTIVPVTTNGLLTLPYGKALSGSNATAWAESILHSLGAPVTSANVSSLTHWFAREGGGGANNPLNTTLSTSGVTGTINSVGVKSYSTPAAGVTATAQTLQGGYPAIVQALKQGIGLSGGSGSIASELMTWSGGGYGSI